MLDFFVCGYLLVIDYLSQWYIIIKLLLLFRALLKPGIEIIFNCNELLVEFLWHLIVLPSPLSGIILNLASDFVFHSKISLFPKMKILQIFKSEH